MILPVWGGVNSATADRYLQVTTKSPVSQIYVLSTTFVKPMYVYVLYWRTPSYTCAKAETNYILPFHLSGAFL
jgi:hypothetical protein